jgi:hypothetical protein
MGRGLLSAPGGRESASTDHEPTGTRSWHPLFLVVRNRILVTKSRATFAASRRRVFRFCFREQVRRWRESAGGAALRPASVFARDQLSDAREGYWGRLSWRFNSGVPRLPVEAHDHPSPL